MVWTYVPGSNTSLCAEGDNNRRRALLAAAKSALPSEASRNGSVNPKITVPWMNSADMPKATVKVWAHDGMPRLSIFPNLEFAPETADGHGRGAEGLGSYQPVLLSRPSLARTAADNLVAEAQAKGRAAELIDDMYKRLGLRTSPVRRVKPQDANHGQRAREEANDSARGDQRTVGRTRVLTAVVAERKTREPWSPQRRVVTKEVRQKPLEAAGKGNTCCDSLASKKWIPSGTEFLSKQQRSKVLGITKRQRVPSIHPAAFKSTNKVTATLPEHRRADKIQTQQSRQTKQRPKQQTSDKEVQVTPRPGPSTCNIPDSEGDACRDMTKGAISEQVATLRVAATLPPLPDLSTIRQQALSRAAALSLDSLSQINANTRLNEKIDNDVMSDQFLTHVSDKEHVSTSPGQPVLSSRAEVTSDSYQQYEGEGFTSHHPNQPSGQSSVIIIPSSYHPCHHQPDSNPLLPSQKQFKISNLPNSVFVIQASDHKRHEAGAQSPGALDSPLSLPTPTTHKALRNNVPSENIFAPEMKSSTNSYPQRWPYVPSHQSRFRGDIQKVTKAKASCERLEEEPRKVPGSKESKTKPSEHTAGDKPSFYSSFLIEEPLLLSAETSLNRFQSRRSSDDSFDFEQRSADDDNNRCSGEDMSDALSPSSTASDSSDSIADLWELERLVEQQHQQLVERGLLPVDD
ncbi:hypothetical protein CEUSTIGMA_g2176.t1 [Chlamydomonas eustigma]|uniref:Uncharacterized protein n=1 Tax=Chlamydomonas eustigma TaxID=1157962 RepID=A0A250WVJ7_9CHLO|nr:hypothetical protein CEUSTIGMA_g2176.t1 [Chlamydomonas eustigma]|eukprot:GAX74729.1 hypothetical protein CEUSTIGMA_g2176.t1 [Chlamydomonas eustigma]